MTDAWSSDFEGLLRRAMAPVEPPARLSAHLEQTLSELTDLAADELDSWELSTMRDPRNWVRPVVAAGVGATAGTALVILRVRGRSKARRQQSSNGVDRAGRLLHDIADEAKKIFDR